MKKTLPVLQQLPVREFPDSGRIVGGKLKRWGFGNVVIDIEGDCEVARVRATPPGWPFPMLEPVTLMPGTFIGVKPSTKKTKTVNVDRVVARIQGAST